MSTNCTDPIQWTNRSLVSAVVYGLVLAVGLPLNTVSLWVLLRRHGLGSSSAVLMINLAASDVLLALSLPLRVYFYATMRWPFGVGTCTAAVMLFRVNIRTSCIFITLISLDRFMALVFPMRSRWLRTPGFASKSCALVWTLVTLLCIPEGLNHQGALRNSTRCSDVNCFESRVKVKGSDVSAVAQAGFMFVLLLINVTCTGMVIWALRRRPKGDASKVNKKMSVVLIFLVNMMVFVVFFLPFALQLMMLNHMDEKRSIGVLRGLICLASINCCLDPLIYYFSLDSFWQDKRKIQGDPNTYSLSRSMERS